MPNMRKRRRFLRKCKDFVCFECLRNNQNCCLCTDQVSFIRTHCNSCNTPQAICKKLPCSHKICRICSSLSINCKLCYPPINIPNPTQTFYDNKIVVPWNVDKDDNQYKENEYNHNANIIKMNNSCIIYEEEFSSNIC